MNRLASGAALSLVIKSVGFSVPGSLESGPDILLRPKARGSEMPYSPQALALANTGRRGGVGVDVQFDGYSEARQD